MLAERLNPIFEYVLQSTIQNQPQAWWTHECLLMPHTLSSYAMTETVISQQCWIRVAIKSQLDVGEFRDNFEAHACNISSRCLEHCHINQSVTSRRECEQVHDLCIYLMMCRKHAKSCTNPCNCSA